MSELVTNYGAQFFATSYSYYQQRKAREPQSQMALGPEGKETEGKMTWLPN